MPSRGGRCDTRAMTWQTSLGKSVALEPRQLGELGIPHIPFGEQTLTSEQLFASWCVVGGVAPLSLRCRDRHSARLIGQWLNNIGVNGGQPYRMRLRWNPHYGPPGQGLSNVPTLHPLLSAAAWRALYSTLRTPLTYRPLEACGGAAPCSPCGLCAGEQPRDRPSSRCCSLSPLSCVRRRRLHHAVAGRAI